MLYLMCAYRSGGSTPARGLLARLGNVSCRRVLRECLNSYCWRQDREIHRLAPEDYRMLLTGYSWVMRGWFLTQHFTMEGYLDE